MGHPQMSKLPLIDFIRGLEGFEFAVFWISAIVVIFAVGYAIDAMLNKTGVGPYWNAVLALIGGYGALYIHDKYLTNLNRYEPYVTFTIVLAGILIVVLTVNLLRARF
jgi:hypothetical protein